MGGSTGTKAEGEFDDFVTRHPLGTVLWREPVRLTHAEGLVTMPTHLAAFACDALARMPTVHGGSCIGAPPVLIGEQAIYQGTFSIGSSDSRRFR